MDIIRTRQKNWIGHILRGNFLQREIIEGRMEGKRGRDKTKACKLDDGGQVRGTQGKGSTSRRVEDDRTKWYSQNGSNFIDSNSHEMHFYSVTTSHKL